MSEWWDSLKPYQRECTWTAVFGLSGLALFAVAALVVWLVAPDLLVDPEYLVVAMTIGVVWGLTVSIGGQLLGYHLEDRHADKVRSRGGIYHV
jgi:uncharacterized membrane protein